MPIDPKRKRWASCGVCTACLATDCGECINCLDKSKFGGQGVRKQSCVKRRCIRMTSSSSGGRGGHPNGNAGSSLREREDGEGRLTSDKADSEQALFWAAVSGCMALNGQGASDADDSSAATLPNGSVRDSSPSSPRSEEHSEDSETMAYRRERDASDPSRSRFAWAPLPGGNFTGSNSFCFKLASILAQDKRLVARPIALRALQLAGIDHRSPAGLASSLSNPTLVAHLANHLSAAAAEGLTQPDWSAETTRAPGSGWTARPMAGSPAGAPPAPALAGVSGSPASKLGEAPTEPVSSERYSGDTIPQLLNLVAQGELLARSTYHFPPRVVPRVQQGRAIERELKNMSAHELTVLNEQQA